MSNPWGRLVGCAVVVVVASCHKTESGVPVPKAFAARDFPECGRRIDLIHERIAPPHRVLSEVFVSCRPYWTDECDDALRARACEIGGDAVLVGELDENTSPRYGTPPPTYGSGHGVRRGRHGRVVVWEHVAGRAADAGSE